MLDRPRELGAHVTAAPEHLRKHEDQEHGKQPGYRDMDHVVDLRAHGGRCEQVDRRLEQRVDHVDAEEEPGDADELHGIRLDERIADLRALDDAPQGAKDELNERRAAMAPANAASAMRPISSAVIATPV